MNNKRVVIIGAGPAGLTAAYELLKKTNIKPIIYEMSENIGGLSQTINYKGNRIDIGGHRFFSKSDKVLDFWKKFLILESEQDNKKSLYNKDNILLIRNRLSRIFFLRKFFNYPITLNLSTLKNLGFLRVTKIGLSYLKVKFLPIKSEKTLQDFFVNRFGNELYETFFKDYTYKVWGVPCNRIDASWGAQRIRGLSISKAIAHAIKSVFVKNKDIKQKNIETTLIEKFMYPKFGPGQMWENVAYKIRDLGGRIYLNHEVIGLKNSLNNITSVKIKNKNLDQVFDIESDYVISSMPIKDLIAAFNKNIDQNVKKIATGLEYRDFMTVGLLLNKLKIKTKENKIIPDNWIYIQERDVKVGRLQIFNNWSPYLVKDQDKIWLGLEYFCNQGDDLWSMQNQDFINFAISELCKIGFIEKEDVIDSVVIRMPKTYPAYFGTYNNFDVIKNFLDKIENLFLIGRNGMHRYNNMDHSMLSAMQAVGNIINGIKTKDNIWAVNTEKEYHETK
ncbi:NAD(P)/FAD-dependent oxidoreductase [Candidatus Babeliales bacterium]|nr:NAD(P)/FAD-dependent oxidoreductase [Candidatus Babeliales bacterium]MCF7899142.1 NAD(P)/FAD-dependent oxidoreductase [Candidatus Babeliales bacterium]